MRKLSRMPVSPASVAAIMKLPTFSRFTRIPASDAPSGLAPAAIVCSPHRVRRRMVCMTITTPTAQMISL